jgi:uncharacterized OB-fold protein
MGKRSAPARPLPSREGPNGEFHARCARGVLAFQECRACGRLQHPPRLLCPACGSDDLGWRESSRRGRLYTWTVTHQAFHPAFADALPYVIAVTELEEGVRLVSGVRDLAPAELELDLPVEVVLETVAEGVALPFVRPRRS